MTSAFTHIRTADCTIIARCPLTGIIASGVTLAEAVAELRRLTASHAHTCEARHPREGLAA